VSTGTPLPYQALARRRTRTATPEIQLAQQSDNVYFLGKLILAESNSVTTGRPGSVRSGGPGEMGYRIGRPRCLTPVARTPYYGRFSRSSWGALTG